MMEKATRALDRLSLGVGSLVSWLTLFMVLVTFLIVILRYVFNLGWVWMQESVLYMHSFVFLLGVGYALFRDAHVRVDIFYRKFSERNRARVNLFGTLFLLFPTSVLIFYEAFPFVRDSWAVYEGSKDGGGIEAVYILKTAVLFFCLLLALQGLSLLIKSFLKIRNQS